MGLSIKMKLRHFLLPSAALLMLLSPGCKPASKSDVAGVYLRAGSGISDTLILKIDGTFKQTVTYTNGNNWSRDGSWEVKWQVAQLDDWYEAFDFEHKRLILPPTLGGCNLLIERGRLVKSEYEPKYIKKPK